MSNAKMPETKCKLCRFTGMVNHCRDMWQHCSELLGPLASSTSEKAKWKWTAVHGKAFNNIKKVQSEEVLSVCVNFKELFEMHTDTSHAQLGAVIFQKGQPMTFCSRKLNPAQMQCTTMERELLSAVETPKESCNMLSGHEIEVCADHENLTHVNFNTEHIMHWHLLIKEFGPELHCTKGTNNVPADALSCLPADGDDVTTCQMSETFAIDPPQLAFLLMHAILCEH